MKKEKKYHRVFFDPYSFEKIFSEFQNIVSDPSKTEHTTLRIKRKGEGWEFDTFEGIFQRFAVIMIILCGESVIQN